MENVFSTIPLPEVLKKLNSHQVVSDYSDILKQYNVHFSTSGYYWQVGSIIKPQGWILHLSVIKSQIINILHIIIPQLIKSEVPFKIARYTDTAESLLNGSLGYINLGKIISIYPDTDSDCLLLAKKIIELTAGFSGPVVPTDIFLGSIVYTRYGAHNPILQSDQNGHKIKFIHNSKKELIEDTYSVPFKMPDGIEWPFSEIASPVVTKTNKLINNAYYPVATIKPDAKGDVIRAIYFKRLWRIKPCLIKQGRQNMFSDDEGRDIRDRLKWQYDVYLTLKNDIPMPEVFEYFHENGDSYLAMEFIKGVSLADLISNIYENKAWRDLEISKKDRLLNLLINLIEIIKTLHTKGFIHRDITPHNFLIDKKERIYLIDMELTWSSALKKPAPPFRLGTPGHMSPEQLRTDIPTAKEDIYGLGGLILTVFTNLPPTKLTDKIIKELTESLYFFTGNWPIANIIADCFSVAPEKRPSLEAIKSTLLKYQDYLKNKTKDSFSKTSEPIKDSSIFIKSAIFGLANSQLLSSKKIWLSRLQRKEDQIGNEQQEMAAYEGWHTGISGPLYLIAKVKELGLDITKCKEVYNINLNYLCNRILQDPEKISPGLYSGSAGIAMALSEGISSELISSMNQYKGQLEKCFLNISNSFNLAEGVAGQGLALLHSSPWLDPGKSDQLLNTFIDLIIRNQESEGYWITSPDFANKKDILTGLDEGVAGIVWFLLSFLEKYENEIVKNCAIKGLAWLLKSAHKKGDLYTWSVSTKSRIVDRWNTGYGIPGIILVLIKAYKVIRDPMYKEVAEMSLESMLAQPIIMDFSLSSGLAGLGEIYIEAASTFKNPLWQERADWIENLFIHSFKKYSDDEGYWSTDGKSIITADFFTGNCGILHFLIRNSVKGKISHPLSYMQQTDLK